MKVTTLENGSPNSAADAADYMNITTLVRAAPAAAAEALSAVDATPQQLVFTETVIPHYVRCAVTNKAVQGSFQKRLRVHYHHEDGSVMTFREYRRLHGVVRKRGVHLRYICRKAA
ncbi:hypothetical protein CWM66_19340 [Kosakonia sp. H7A]|uniref:hypothetical protein n=1 Tax=Kosakonia sp. H7A TaxID=2054598 RepID=UPI000D15AA06|nr:hypothetical protein [Kosakonia sp. H7A]PTA89253.1 hypothetical protein CWM66_19340 [Kosakonia sp. H7A]